MLGLDGKTGRVDLGLLVRRLGRRRGVDVTDAGVCGTGRERTSGWERGMASVSNSLVSAIWDND